MLLTRESGKVHYRVALLLAFAFVFALIVGSAVLAYRNALDQIEATMTDAETGRRGYLLTGEDHFLEPWLAATGQARAAAIRRPPIGALLALLRARTLPQGVERELLARIDRLVADKLAELQQTIALRQAGRASDALAIVREGRGKRTMDALRTTLAALLGLAGHATRLAHTGREAIALAGQEAFDIAFLDIGLPDMTGGDTLCLVALAGALPDLALPEGAGA